MRRGVAPLGVLAACAALLVLAPHAEAAPVTAAARVAAAAPVAASAPASTPTATSRVFGPLLNLASDADQAYAERLGATPGLFGETIGYPLSDADTDDLTSAAHAASAQGASLLIRVEPRVALTKLTGADASTLADDLDALHTDLDLRVLVDFAPDMNGSWTTWGQQPRNYVAAYRTVASAVHRTATSASMVWAPSNGAGYPFGTSRGAVTPSGPRVRSQLDTNGDGKVDERDDPYGPYWPGSASVDEVGFSDFWYGPSGALGSNVVPPAGFFAKTLTGAVGYSTPTGSGRNFVARFSVDQHKPMLVETAALYVPSRGGATAAAIQQAWIDQVFAASVRADFPTLDTVLWFEQRRPEAEAGGAVVDWRTTMPASTATELRTALTAAGYRLGPVSSTSGRTQANAAAAQAYQAPGSDDSQADRVLVSVAILLGLFLLAGLAARRRPGWRYRPDSPGSVRDGRIDLLRGFVIVAVVATHVEVAGPWSWFVLRAGALTGAEMFVLLSGIVLGTVYPRMAETRGELSAATRMVRRAARLYVVTVVVIVAIFLLSKIPGLDATSVTTFTDRGTGATGEGAAGRVYYLYGTAQHLLDYPPPAYAIKDLLLLRYGPWPINIMGLFVILSLAVPAAMWLVRRGLWWVLLVVSWALYVLNAMHHLSLFDAQFEAVFPLLAWQIAFTHGLVIGYYRDRIVTALTSRPAKVIITAVLGLYVALLLVLRSGASLGGLPAYDALYDDWYLRTNLDGGRLFDLVVSLVCVYALLTCCWRPLHASIGRFFEPLGRNSLEVFFIQVFLVLIVGNIPHLDRSSDWQGFLVQTGCFAVVWLLLRKRGAPSRDATPPSDVPAERPKITRVTV